MQHEVGVFPSSGVIPRSNASSECSRVAEWLRDGNTRSKYSRVAELREGNTMSECSQVAKWFREGNAMSECSRVAE